MVTGAPYNAPHLPPMSLLVITLLPGAPGAYPYVTSIDGQTPERHGASPALSLIHISEPTRPY